MTPPRNQDAPAESPRRGHPPLLRPVTLECFPLGPFETNCYIVLAPGKGGDAHCWIVDPGYEPAEVIERVQALGLTPDAILLTHAHADHIAGLAEVRAAFPKAPIIIHEAEAGWLADPQLNLSAAIGVPVIAPGPDRLLHDGDSLHLGASEWKVLHTPGHSPGSITLYHAPIALVGDTLFADSVGRTDFPGSDPHTLALAIKSRLYSLPDDTAVHPGHGPATTIGREKRTNPFVRA